MVGRVEVKSRAPGLAPPPALRRECVPAKMVSQMVNRPPQALDATFSALADPVRRAILLQLTEGEASVSQLAEPFDISLPAISRHLRVLEQAGLLAREKRGRVHRISLVADPMMDALEWIARTGRFWEAQFDSLERFLKRASRRGAGR
jgi:DNA-binding transcriptional ArsR family regulator